VGGASATEWIDNLVAGKFIDYQFTTSNSVCIDPDATAVDIYGEEQNGPQTALYFGSLECLDEPDWVFRYDSYKL